jgi:dihydrofolate synthase/folylpolyglutamate synthase
MSSSYEKLFKRTTKGIKPGLEIITALLDALDNPHQRLAVLHVAGTNGKGSVCAMLDSVLRIFRAFPHQRRAHSGNPTG